MTFTEKLENLIYEHLDEEGADPIAMAVELAEVNKWFTTQVVTLALQVVEKRKLEVK